MSNFHRWKRKATIDSNNDKQLAENLWKIKTGRVPIFALSVPLLHPSPHLPAPVFAQFTSTPISICCSTLFFSWRLYLRPRIHDHPLSPREAPSLLRRVQSVGKGKERLLRLRGLRTASFAYSRKLNKGDTGGVAMNEPSFLNFERQNFDAA